MANVAHASLTGAELHEPKGVDNANLGDVYVANGSGSGAWTPIAQTSFTGQVADFATPLPPTGWLECDGSDINITTYSGLYDVITIRGNGTRINGNATITSLSTTLHMRVGYYVFGTGIASGTTIISIDSATQITLSSNTSSSGTSEVVVSPWLLNTGTIRLPNFTSVGRFKRSRTSTTAIGSVQADQNKAHTHTGSGTTSSDGAHSHTVTGSTGVESQPHSHVYVVPTFGATAQAGGDFSVANSTTTSVTGDNGVQHTHTVTGSTSLSSSHTHTYSFTTASDGGTEVRPLNITLMTCIKY